MTDHAPRPGGSSIAILLALSLGLAALLWHSLRPADLSSARLDYRVESYDTAKGELAFSLTIEGAGSGNLQLAVPPQSLGSIVSRIEASSGGASCIVGDSRIVCPAEAGRTIALGWIARPGLPGRHGRQGHVGSDFVLFGRGALILPSGDFRGEVGMQLPDQPGWERIGPARLSGAGALERFADANFAHGPFRTVRDKAGSIELAISFPSAWPAELAERTRTRAVSILSSFEQIMPVGEPWSYELVLTPASPRGKVSGYSSSRGQAFSFEDYPGERRAWELFAHRYSHIFNRYSPLAILFGASDDWFVEGWSALAEISRLAASGIASVAERRRELEEWYVRAAHGLEDGHSDLSLASASRASGPELEYLHYCKAPLVLLRLEKSFFSGGGAAGAIDALMAGLYERFGRGGAPDLWRELARAGGGADLAAFRKRFISGTTLVVLESAQADPGDPAEAMAGHLGALLELAHARPGGPRPDGLIATSPLLAGLRALNSARAGVSELGAPEPESLRALAREIEERGMSLAASLRGSRGFEYENLIGRERFLPPSARLLFYEEARRASGARP